MKILEVVSLQYASSFCLLWFVSWLVLQFVCFFFFYLLLLLLFSLAEKHSGYELPITGGDRRKREKRLLPCKCLWGNDASEKRRKREREDGEKEGKLICRDGMRGKKGWGKKGGVGCIQRGVRCWRLLETLTWAGMESATWRQNTSDRYEQAPSRQHSTFQHSLTYWEARWPHAWSPAEHITDNPPDLSLHSSFQTPC